MPLVRYEIRNELSLGGPKLNQSSIVEDEEPKSILSAVEVAGLVGLLRQLGDLAEFSAEVFNGIQEEVTVTASRCVRLTGRVKRIETALSPLEKAVLSQTSHIHFAYTAGCEWHPRIRNGQRHFVQSDLPLCVMETYEQCRDPPPLHQLDRFNADGPGSCLRKYSDPTFFRKDLSNSIKADDGKVQRDQAHRKRKKKRLPQRNICRSRAVSVSTSEETNGARLSFLTDDKQATSESTSTVDMPRSSNMEDLSDIVDQSHLHGQSDTREQSEAQVQSDFQESSKPRDSVTGSGYIEYVINQSPVNNPDVKLFEGFLSSLQPADRISSAVPEGCIEVVDDNILYSPSEDIPVPCASIVCDEKKETLDSTVEKSNTDEQASEIHESKFGPETPDRVRQNIRDIDRTYSFFDEVDIVGEKQSKSQTNGIEGKPGINNQDFDRTYNFFDEVGQKLSKSQDNSTDGKSGDRNQDVDRTYSFFDEVDIVGGKQSKSQDNSNEGIPGIENEGEDKSEQESEADEFLDARNTIDSESESEHDGVPKPNLEHYFGDISTYCSEDANSDNNDGSEDIPFEPVADDPRLDDSLDESCSYCSEDANDSCFLSDQVCGEAQSHDACFQKPREFFAEETIPGELREEPVDVHPLLEGDCADEKISYEEPIASGPSLEDALPAEKNLPEEHMASYLSLIEAFPHDKILPEESVAKSPSLAEVVPDEKLMPEKPLPKLPYLAEAMPDNMRTRAEEPDLTSKAAQDDKCPPDFLDSTSLSVPEGVSQEEFVGIEACLAETVPDERFLSKAMPIEKVLPEKTLEVHHSMAELPIENILEEKSVEAAHPSCVKVAPEEDISAEGDSTNLSVEALPQEEMLLGEIVGIDQCMVEAVPDDSTEEPVTTCLSSERDVAMEKVLLEEPLETYPCLAELHEEENSHEEAADPTHQYFSPVVSDEKVSPQVLDPAYLSVEEAISQEQLSLEEEFVGIDPCLGEAVPDETTCLSLEKTVATEQVLSEELLETYPSLVECSGENISNEEADTHPSFSEAVRDEKISREVLDSTNYSLEDADTQEQTLLEEDVGIYLVEAVPDERGLPEESTTTCMSLTNVVPIEKVLPDESLEAYASLKQLPKEELSQENSNDATLLSCAKSEIDETVSPEVSPQEQLSLEEDFVGIDPCLGEAVPDERFLPEEPITTCLSLSEAEPVKNVLPLEPLEVYPSQEELLEEKILREEEPDDETTSPLQGPGSTYPSLEESVLHEKTLLEEHIDTNPFSESPALNERSFPDENGVTYQSPVEAVSKENNLPEEPLPKYSSLAEAVFSLEEPDATCPPFTEASPHNKSFPEDNSTEMSLAEASFDENISGSEAPGSTTEAVPHNKSPGSTTEDVPHNKSFAEEHVPTDMALAEAVFDEKIPGSESPDYTTETSPHNKTLPEEFVATPSGKHVPDDNIPPKEPSAGYLDLADGIPDQQVFLDDAAFLSFAEAIFDQKFSPDVPDTQESVSDDTSAEPVSIWSNGVLLGLAPLKPPVFAGPNSVSEHMQNEINEEASVLATRKQESSVEDTEKSSLSLVASDQTSQQQSNMLSHSNGSLSQLQSTATSFKVFGLSHKLLMAGFRGNSSSTCKFESIPTTSYGTEVAAIEDRTRQAPRGSSFEEQLDYESSLFGSPTSSPPVQHMKISFNPVDASPISKLKLRIPQRNGENADMFPSFQLVPEASNSDGDNSDIFCQSSPCVSDHGLSDSELWESDVSPRSRHNDIGSFSGSSLDLPCFDAVDHQSTCPTQDQDQEQEQKPSVLEIIRQWPPNKPKSQS